MKSRLLKLIMLVLLLHPCVAVHAQPAKDDVIAKENVADAAASQKSVPERRSRLKFKSAGPVCMCGNELSEKDIAAQQQRENSK